jgi:hypothetical protein
VKKNSLSSNISFVGKHQCSNQNIIKKCSFSQDYRAKNKILNFARKTPLKDDKIPLVTYVQNISQKTYLFITRQI